MNIGTQFTSDIRSLIREDVANIPPFDLHEKSDIEDVLAWIDSGVEIFRTQKPATPPKHLICYFILVDGDHVLLVDHKDAQLWLPTGGHVEVDEHPRVTVVREALEELGLDTPKFDGKPAFLSISETVGRSAGHTDIALWYVVEADKDQKLNFDHNEFNNIAWFHKDEVPFALTDPHLKRFLAKYYRKI